MISNTTESDLASLSENPPAGSADVANATTRVADWLKQQTGLSQNGAQQMADYFVAVYKALGVIPSRKKLVMERFFDESGGMQLVIHSPFGIRINRAWGLALRKRFCRSFNFELQAAASDDAIVMSLGTIHSFPLEEVFRYLNSKTVRELLVQALLDAPMFGIRWRWNATRALALPRQRGGRKIPAPLQRMESENLLSAVFPDQLACLENIVGDRQVPEHPLVQQTIEDCLTEAMDIDGLIDVLRKIENGEVECFARDLPEPSPLAHEILNARPYAFLDDAPLEERRTQAVYTRRAGDSGKNSELGILDAAAIERVTAEAWPQPMNSDELHEALLLAGAITAAELNELNGKGDSGPTKSWLDELIAQKRTGRFRGPPTFWVAAERLPMLQAIYPEAKIEPLLTAPETELKRNWERAEAIRELLRGRMEISGPTTASALAEFFQLRQSEIDAGLLALEAEGFVLRGKFHPGAQETEWCDRRLLARIHRLTINRLRAEIQPVTVAEFQRFLAVWQRVDQEHRAEGPEGVRAILELLDGYDLPAAAWEPQVLVLRVKDYDPHWLDQLCFTGRVGWGRLSPRQNQNGRPASPVRSSPVSVFERDNLAHWLELSGTPSTQNAPDTQIVLEILTRKGALFFGELVKETALLPSRVEQALGELSAQGWVTSDSFEGLRALLMPQDKRASFTDAERRRRHKTVTSVEFAGRWSLLRINCSSRREEAHFNAKEGDQSLLTSAATSVKAGNAETNREPAIETFARALLRRYGVVFRRLLERESLKVSWYELGRVYRRSEARGEIRGGYFVSGVSGEQFALPEAIGLLRSIRKTAPKGELIAISGADPLNLAGILTPGPRITSVTANRLLLRDGVAVAALEAGNIVMLENEGNGVAIEIERALRVGKMSGPLRRYYA
jgi:ATP-dependent helicase Lhr and Lhr-like helicase